MISCENISKSFPGQSVIENFSYRFSDTGLYLLYGESGSGKTTFLNILAGFLPFEGGSIEWNGQTFDKQVDKVITKETVEYIKTEPLIKAIVAGHIHLNYSGYLTKNIPQITTSCTDIRVLEID